MHKVIRLAALAAAFAAAGAQAQTSQVYVEANYVPTKITGSHGLNDDPKPSAFLGIIGFDLHPNLALEGALGASLNSDSARAAGANFDVDAKFKSTYGLYLKPRYRVSDAIELFARIGYLRSKVELTGPAGSGYASRSGTEGSTAYGLGANFGFAPNTYLTLGYNHFYKEGGVKVQGLNLGVGYRF